MGKILELHPHKGETWLLRTDFSEQTYFLHVSVVLRFALAEGGEMDGAGLDEVLQAQMLRRVYSYGCYLLDYRDYGAGELTMRLARKYPQAVCAQAVQRLVENGLIDDERYAQNLARHYVEIKGYGRRRAAQEMAQRRLDRRVIDEALSAYDEIYDDHLQTLIGGRFSRYFEDKDDRRMIEKGKAALVRRGYTYAEIEENVRKYLEMLEEEEIEEE